MKNLKKFLLVTSLTLLLCCSKENIKEAVQSPQEIVKTNIVKDYLAVVKSELVSAAKNRLDSVQSNLLWEKATYVLQSSEKSIIQIPINEGKVLALFYMSGAKTKVDSSIICLLVNEANSTQKNTRLEFGKKDLLVSKIVRPSFSVKNGDIKTYSIDNLFKKEYHFENDKLAYTKEIAPEEKKKGNSIKSNETCWNYFWVWRYPDGYVEREFLYQLCECDEQAYSIDFRNVKEVTVKRNCASGGSSSSTLTDPPPCPITLEEADNILSNFQSSTNPSTGIMTSNGSTYDPIEDIVHEPMSIKLPSFFKVKTYYPGILGVIEGEWDLNFTGERYKESPYSAYATWKWSKMEFVSIENSFILILSTCADLSASANCSDFVIDTDKKKARAQITMTGNLKITCYNMVHKKKAAESTAQIYLYADQ